jgi:predicted metal-dependent enzyme (double-stranded beta helix superfamily)
MLRAVVFFAALLPQSVPHVSSGEDVESIIDNEQFSVWDVTWAPGEANPMHPHGRDFVSVFLDGGSIQITSADGTSRSVTHEPGDVVFEPKGAVAAERNVSENDTVRAIVIDLKDAPVSLLPNTTANPRSRIQSEALVSGRARAIILETK